MKTIKNHLKATLAALSLALLLALPGRAQVITYLGMTAGSQMPGSPNDYIFFNAQNFSYQDARNVPGQPGENLTSFSMSGGLPSVTLNNDDIIPPGGTTAIPTGVVTAQPGLAFQLVLGTDPSNNGGNSGTALNSSFNYNDFNVWIMFSNLPGSNGTDTNISLTPYFPTDTSNPADSPTVWGTNTVNVTDNNTTPGVAYFLEFNVSGMEAASLLAGEPIDMALTANFAPNGVASGQAYIGGVSFESIAVPEPQAWLLMGAGCLALVWISRRGKVATKAGGSKV